jgi:hypothetical protein
MTGDVVHDMQFMYEREIEPLYFSVDSLSDWSKGDTDEIYSFKVVRAASYDKATAPLTDAQCRLVLSGLEAQDWSGLTKEDIRMIARLINDARLQSDGSEK